VPELWGKGWDEINVYKKLIQASLNVFLTSTGFRLLDCEKWWSDTLHLNILVRSHYFYIKFSVVKIILKAIACFKSLFKIVPRFCI
jgi:hypothetical protein